MAQLPIKKQQQKSLSTNLNNWLINISQAKFDDQELRKVFPEIQAFLGSSMPYGAIFTEYGIVVVTCDRCGLPTYSGHTTAAYQGALSICNACMKDYSICDKCKTYVLTCDLDNPTHTHSLMGKPGKGSFLNEEMAQVEAWNADIMALRENPFKKTTEEMTIWKHQKEAHIPTLRKAHSVTPFRFFGIELEVEKAPGGPGDLLERTRNVLDDYVIVKHDGSLSNKGKGGFEIVTVPATLRYHKSGVWDRFFEYLGPFFQESPQTTGLHIHIGLDTIGEIIASKMLVFVNSPANQEFIESIACRELGTPNPNGKVYASLMKSVKMSDLMRLRQHKPDCSWNPKNKASSMQYVIEKNGVVKKDQAGNPIIASLRPSSIAIRPVCKCAPGLYNLEKYAAFNLMTKRATVEIRIFRGLVNKEFLYAALEFGDALADFCSETSPSNLHYRDFLKWLCRLNDSGRTKLYPNLSRHLINKSWIDPSKLSLKPEIRKVVLPIASGN